MDEAAINKLVEERVAAALAARDRDESQQAAIRERQSEHKMRADSALMRLAANGRDEVRPLSDYTASYGDAQRIKSAIQHLPCVTDLTNEMYAECYGPEE